ncbi:hypothetical protein, partial [Marinobacter sp.]|uniref:hypothetical protein n=1 Tax=Marinobacter sp. TaxID=50741 RepID=UPI00356AD69E
KVIGSNPIGRAIIFKGLRENAGLFYLAVSKLCPLCVRTNSEGNWGDRSLTFALNETTAPPEKKIH